MEDLIQDRLKYGEEELRRMLSARPSAAPVQAQLQAPSNRRQPLIIMYNVKHFLEEAVYGPADMPRANSGRIAEDVVQINHKRQIGSASDKGIDAGGLSGANRAERSAAAEELIRFFLVDGVDALSKFGDIDDLFLA